MSEPYDAVVIGSGPGGYVCAIRLAQLGQRTALIERGELGGVCLNWGCIPSKALIHASKLREEMSHAAAFGIGLGGEAPVELDKLRSWKQGIVKKLTGGIGQLLKKNKVEVIKGSARLLGPGSIAVASAAGEERRIETKSIVLATGCRPVELPPFPHSNPRVWTSKPALELEEIPEDLVVIGGGIIGLELGMAYRKLGCNVTVVELTGSILPGTERELSKLVDKRLKALGIALHTKAMAKEIIERKDGRAELLMVTEDGSEERLVCDRVLVSVGFRPNSESLGLETAGVRLTERGYLPKNERCETNVPGIYAIGDLTGPPFLAHRASREGIIAAEVIAGLPSALDHQVTPSAIFTDPEIASVGMTEAEAKAAGHDVRVGRFPYAALGRALAANAPDGFFKIVSEAGSGLVLGVGIVGHEASNLIAEAALCIEMAGTTTDLALTVHAHPTLPEGLMECAEDALGHAIHVYRRPRKLRNV